MSSQPLRWAAGTSGGTQQPLGTFFTQFDVPVGEIEEMFPTIVVRDPEIDLDKRPPFGAFGFAYQMDPGLVRRAVGLPGVARNAAADDVFPACGTSPVAGNDVVEVQILPVEEFSAILAGITIPLEDVVAGEFDLLFRKAVKHDQHDHSGNADFERNRVDALRMGCLLGEIMPLAEVVSLELAIRSAEHHLGVTLKEKRKSPPCRADVDSLPEAVQDEDLLRKEITHAPESRGP